MKRYETNNEMETFNLGVKLGEEALPGEIYCLNGDLGTGKTVISKGFGKGLGIKAHITSPTYTIIQVYEEGRLPLYHFDVYRIGDLCELEEIGYEEYFYGQGVTIVEWSVLVKELMPKGSIEITLSKDMNKGLEYRLITIEESK